MRVRYILGFTSLNDSQNRLAATLRIKERAILFEHTRVYYTKSPLLLMRLKLGEINDSTGSVIHLKITSRCHPGCIAPCGSEAHRIQCYCPCGNLCCFTQGHAIELASSAFDSHPKYLHYIPVSGDKNTSE